MITLMPDRFEDPMREEILAEFEKWRDSWNDDDRLLAVIPPGYWFDLVLISFVKRLLKFEMPDDLRLRYLELLHGYVNGLISLDVMRRVEPACDTFGKMVEEIQKLHHSDQFAVMRKWNVMASFCNLNSSLIEAMKLFPNMTPFSRERVA